MNCAYAGSCYNELVTGDTLVSNRFPEQLTRHRSRSRGVKWTTYAAMLMVVALLSGISTYSYSYMNKPIMPVACIETIHVLKAGQSASCYDPRSRIDIVSNSHFDVAALCKCNQ